MKKTVLATIAAIGLLGAGLSFGTTTPNVQAATSTTQADDKGQLLINYVPGYSIAVWNSPSASRQLTGKFLKHGTAVRYSGTDRNSNNGIEWYQIGANQWISSRYTAWTSSNVGTQIQSLTVDYVPGYSIAVWNTPLNGRKPLAKKLKNGTTWKTFAAAQVGQDMWYNLGGNQWVSVHYIHLNETK
ncbi:SLAP domain-containing protein [Lacticaseibacillus brantae]|uniref:Uncharacterized protein n=1 Tax=Lacticaseibacillus brantae DSM 23927 TaxID=1423727 RepID=A0A0R2AXK2_9LACO|nr:SLAP domain-containing protein [Lacticaseibacillus brantae]KRM72061.1 hypothetical protein FC34_GL001044 [Lacticaseibacillus brantae DSM 23927]